MLKIGSMASGIYPKDLEKAYIVWADNLHVSIR